MESAHAEAANRLSTATSPPYAWGCNGRTISSRAGTDHWLRVEATPDDRASTRLPHEGITGAENLPDAVPRPRLHATVRWTKDGWTYDADLISYILQPVISQNTPELLTDPDLTDGWWDELHQALEVLAGVATERETVRTLWMRRSFPLFLGIDAPDHIERATGHGDLHWANLTGDPLTVMDWERWGSVPVGFDAGLLHAATASASPRSQPAYGTSSPTSSTLRPDGSGNSPRSANCSSPSPAANTPTSPKPS
ncbi:hypothetical protein [Streptomyces sp. NPDC058674]|uniref:hypothetical protein n=1 Tax=Streptomyces sp. NPDC058674 TaxID=3346592 RepID=UPI003657018A